MNDDIRIYVEKLFENAPKTRKAHELQEEMIANLSEKYNDLLAKGKSPEESFNLVVAGIGDIDELISSLGSTDVFNIVEQQKQRKKTALVVAVAVMLYVLSLVSVIVGEEVFRFPSGLSISLMFIIAGCATGLLIYHFMSQPKYVKEDDTIVEEFKEWKASSNQNNRLRIAITSTFWPLLVAAYFVISFAFGNWYISWVIFIIGAAIDRIIKVYFEAMNSKATPENPIKLRRAVSSAMWTLIAALYFIISFTFGIWYISWVIFIIGAAIEQIVRAFFDMKG